MSPASSLSPGKRRGLLAASNSAHIFTILALDHGASLAKTIRPDDPESVSYSEMVAVKDALLRHLSAEASAVLIDPVYGLAPAVLGDALPGNVGLLLAVEDGDYASAQEPARLFPGWSVAQAVKAGATAIKCFFYYHPDEPDLAQQQEAFVQELVQECQEHQLPLFAEPLSYNADPTDRPRVVIETARRISRLGIDILKVEFPIDSQHEPDEAHWIDACAALDEACAVPWALLSAGVDFETFARQVRIACRAGASGYLAGRAVWKEAVPLSGEAQIEALKSIALPRLRELSAIATEFGRAWSEHYLAVSEMPSKDWHRVSDE